MIAHALCLMLAASPNPLRVGSERHWVEGGVGLQIRLSNRDELAGVSQPALELRRTRFSLRGSFFDGALTFGSQLNTGPSTPEVIDAWVGLSPVPAVAFKVGQFKTPFTRYRANSFVALPLTDWALAAFQFGAERQLGAQVEVSVGQALRWSGTFGVFSGENARASFARGLPELYGERLTDASDLRAPRLPASVHPELFARAGGERTEGPVRAWAYLSAAWDLQPQRAFDYQLRLAPELKLRWRELGLEVVGYAGWAPDAQGVAVAAGVGATVELTWQLHPRVQLAARWSRGEALPAARADAAARAAQLLSGNPDPAQATRLRGAGGTSASQELLGGATVDLIDGWLKLQLEAGSTRREGRSPLDALRLRSQLQFAL